MWVTFGMLSGRVRAGFQPGGGRDNPLVFSRILQYWSNKGFQIGPIDDENIRSRDFRCILGRGLVRMWVGIHGDE